MGKEELEYIGKKVFGFGWQTKLARCIGISPQHFRRYISGKTILPISKQNHIFMIYFLHKNNLWLEYQTEVIYKKVK